MKKKLLDATLYTWFRIEEDKRTLAEKVFVMGTVLGILSLVLDLAIKHNRTILEPVTLLIGITIVFTYILLTIGRCLEVKEKRTPFWTKILLSLFLCGMTMMSIVVDINEKPDKSFTYLWILFTVASIAFLYNGYLTKRSNEKKV